MKITPIDYSLGYMYHTSIHDLSAIEERLRYQSETGYILLDCGEKAQLQYLQLYYNGYSLDTDNIDILELEDLTKLRILHM